MKAFRMYKSVNKKVYKVQNAVRTPVFVSNEDKETLTKYFLDVCKAFDVKNQEAADLAIEIWHNFGLENAIEEEQKNRKIRKVCVVDSIDDKDREIEALKAKLEAMKKSK